MRFRKKPVVIEAVEVKHALFAARTSWAYIPKWLHEAYEQGNIVFLDSGVNICTLEGWMHADIGDWIIQGIKGEIYSCKPDIFELTYESAEPVFDTCD